MKPAEIRAMDDERLDQHVASVLEQLARLGVGELYLGLQHIEARDGARFESRLGQFQLPLRQADLFIGDRHATLRHE